MTTRITPHLSDHRVLIANGSPGLRRLLNTLVGTLAMPAGIDEACCGTCALDTLVETPAGLVIADACMDQMDGLALLTAMRREARLARVPVILLRDPVRDPTPSHIWKAAGADAVLDKPLSLRKFAVSLRDTAERTAVAHSGAGTA
ncbi:hypothetical protein C882_1954 [Caenispirillum salinarum AK4]|uniref:Response regulatory domain-containing protein n=1 Tax=Caenispirillum salinarum AK4 TaxID=1238182 RepID=K9GLY7_9PROT|nr:response regulator [Caenispirillum salinarum]EKV27025.1 hypothetical protein C882_1954 [Caenispirillum salinarum AK4]